MQLKRMTFAAELKADDSREGVITGYGSIFGNTDSYGDVVEKGAFARSLKERGLPVMLWQHDTSQPIGIYLNAAEDDNGLRLEGQLNLDVAKGREAYSLLKQGALKGMSIGYRVAKCDYDKDGVRRLKDLDLYEVSLVTFPANEMAGITGVKADFPDNERDFEALLREVGCPRELAKAIVAKGFRAAVRSPREAETDAAIDGLLRAVKLLAGEKTNGNGSQKSG